MTSTDSVIIKTVGISKTFKEGKAQEVKAVEEVSFQIEKGELFGFLGPNGAGKTTTINMLTGLARPDKGVIFIDGTESSTNLKTTQHLMGIVPDESNLYPELTGFENLMFCGALYGMGKAERERRTCQLLRQFGLSQYANRKFSKYSKGMKRKLTIAAGIMHSPPILFLDEPTTGIDIASARQIRQLIYDLNQEGTTIFLTTHYIEEAERLCQRIAFIVSGKIVRIDTIENLMKLAENRYIVQFSLSKEIKNITTIIEEQFADVKAYISSGTILCVESQRPISIGPYVRLLESFGAETNEARNMRPSLEEVFVEITGIEAKDMKNER
jgi:ABC-2 type transport system ATP-binding protein